MKRTIFLALIVFVFATMVLGQTLSIQGVLRDDTGASVADGPKNFTFKLYTVTTGGIKVWDETQTVTVTNGVYSATLGAVNPLDGLDYSVSYWLGVSIDGAEEMSPRTKLTLSPYAIASVSGVDNVFPQSGSVGIGTTTPATSLDIRDDDPAITVATPTGTGGALYLGNSAHGVKREYNNGNDVGLYTTNADIYLSGAGTSTNYFVLKNNGNVGIGTANPSFKLHVNGQIYASSGIKVPSTGTVIQNSSNGRAIMQTGWTSSLGDFTAVNSGYDWDTGHEPVSMIASYYGFLVTKAQTAGTPFGETLFKVGTNGKVGINTTSPAYELDVNGTIRLSSSHLVYNSTHGVINWGGGNLYFRTNPTVGNPDTYDDEAWIEPDGDIKASAFISIGYDKSSKSSAKSYENNLNRTLQLNPVSFQKSDGRRLGFYADELKKVIPEVVNEDDGIMGIDYGAMSVVAISAIQDQQKIIENQQKEIDDLKERLNRLEALVRKQ